MVRTGLQVTQHENCHEICHLFRALLVRFMPADVVNYIIFDFLMTE